MSHNLNQISHQMKVGHTDYVPPDETRNFKALFPLSDEVKDRIDTTPSIVFHVDPELYPPDKVTQYEDNINRHPLPTLDYRKLAWGSKASHLLLLQDTMHKSSINSPFANSARQRKSLTGPRQSTETEMQTLPELEAYYRGLAASSFRIDPMACHLIDQSAAVAQDRKLKARLGNSVILLNDPVYAEWLRGVVQKEMENAEEGMCLKRELNEIERNAASKKKGRYVTDELFNAMRLPEVCDQKPWMWSRENREEKQASLESDKAEQKGSDSRETSQCPSLPPISRPCRKNRAGLPCRPCPKPQCKPCKKPCAKLVADHPSTSTQSSGSHLEGSLDSHVETPHLSKTVSDTTTPGGGGGGSGGSAVLPPIVREDRLSEMLTVVDLLENADNILNYPKQYTKYTLDGKYLQSGNETSNEADGSSVV